MRSFAADLATMVLTRLGPKHVDAMRAKGTERDMAPGEIIATPGAAMSELRYVLEGEAEAFDSTTD